MKQLNEAQIREMARQEQLLLVCDDLEALTEIVRATERALAAIDTAQPVQVNAMLVEALEGFDAAFNDFDLSNSSSRNNMRQAVIKARAALTAAKQAQPERAPLPISNWQDEAYAKLDALCDKMSGQDTIVVRRFIRRDIGPVPIETTNGIKQGGQHD